VIYFSVVFYCAVLPRAGNRDFLGEDQSADIKQEKKYARFVHLKGRENG
jgi:hypothetical protein